MRNLKIGYFADGPWSHIAFEKIINDPTIEIKFITPRFDSKDETLKNFSEKYSIPYLKSKNINSDEFLSQIAAFGCDLLVSMSFNQIFKKKLIEFTPLKVINCHAGKLPFYRGRNILNWALINNEKEFGITVHYIDDGIDTGDIILQRTFPITDDDNYDSLLHIAYNECASILYDSLKLFQNGTPQVIRQDTIHPVGFYCGVRSEGDEVINWNQSSREVFDFIRAICSPGPIATTYVTLCEVKINSCKLFMDAPVYRGTPGQIIGKTDKGLIIKTKDSFVEILDIITSKKLKVGDRFNIYGKGNGSCSAS